MTTLPRVLIWNEFRHEKQHAAVAAVYPDGIHEAIAQPLRAAGFPVRTATLDEPEHGLSDAGMGLVVLHSGHFSKLFKRLMGASCDLKWREADERERIWVVAPGHPIAAGLGEHFELAREEMYGEFFDIPAPDELVFVSWFQGGEVFRSGCCYTRGAGRIFYFRPGHETYPTYYDANVQRVIANAARWAAPTAGVMLRYGHRPQPLEKLAPS